MEKKYQDAEALCQRALDIADRTLGPDHPAVGMTLMVMADLHHAQGKEEEAKDLYRRSEAILEKSTGQIHPDVADAFHGLGAVYENQQDYVLGAALYTRVLEIREEVFGEDHPDVAQSLDDYRRTLRHLGKRQEAQALENRAKAIRNARRAQASSK